MGLHMFANRQKGILIRTWSADRTHRVLVVLQHLGFGFEVVCGWHRVFIPAVPLLQNVGVQPRLHGRVQDHLELRRLHLARHSDAAVLFTHQTLRTEGWRRRQQKMRNAGTRELTWLFAAALLLWCRWMVRNPHSVWTQFNP